MYIYVCAVSNIQNTNSINNFLISMSFPVTYSFAKREHDDESDVKDGEIHLQIIELIKDEYKVN